ncbi:type II secretion system minor pseudopilin GspK [Sphingomonas oligophenolica]|uniref:type II secretion system minor pseudopilin GspK n=1 Tax=Sphingomonas oligophenolica TaxID=301154 RepID=UPI0018835BAB|nr:type II secretion system minor pseudopilin GspK [Sphingomonas oligophenolica]
MQPRKSAVPARERGAALLTVLLLVAVIAVLAGTALERLRLSTRLAGNAAAGAQARGYAEAAEALAVTRISNLLGKDNTRVTLAGGWSGAPFGLPLPGGGTAIARVTDGGNCFNLNGLVSESAPGVYTTYPTARVEFARLMRLIQIPAGSADRIAASTADWIDTDQNQQPSGAEDGTYIAKPTPYRTAGTLMADPSELRAIDGVTPDIYATLRPYVCTKPKAELSRINVNTLQPEKAALVAMLYPDTMSVAQAQTMLVRRPPDGYPSVAIFLNGASGIVPDTGGDGQLSVTSGWFALTIDVNLNGTQLREHALIDATRLPARLVSRQWGEQT